MGCEFVGFCEFFQFNQFNVIEWLIGVITTFALIFLFRAKIRVNEIKIIRNKSNLIRLKIPVLNNSYLFYATNIIIEAALIVGNLSYHFNMDRNEFILIPNKCFRNNCNANERTFQTMNFEQATIDLLDENENYETVLNNIPNNATLRIRIHANHEFTNFGKAFEFIFRYDGTKFIKI
ncbi:hypothetical protein [Flavobacterium soyangense]|uniref:Uncharacterized protein n=1 Tax=Flavobacterium soyangense TaxID=2023265 RepID=A0A930UEA3_9FLAO|nr:hypothetical protein [Flavobacterium soyangense]MBF2709736.1 hypothetical protein [Flavobacterium soyangense]